jgi:hypothetical protein
VFPEESIAVTVTLKGEPEVEAGGALTVKATHCAHAAASNSNAATAMPTSLAAVIKRVRMRCVLKLDTAFIAAESLIRSKRATERVPVLLRLFA